MEYLNFGPDECLNILSNNDNDGFNYYDSFCRNRGFRGQNISTSQTSLYMSQKLDAVIKSESSHIKSHENWLRTAFPRCYTSSSTTADGTVGMVHIPTGIF